MGPTGRRVMGGANRTEGEGRASRKDGERWGQRKGG